MAIQRQQLIELVQAHQAELYRYLKYLGADHEVAQDVAQDTFIRAFRAAGHPDMSNVAARRSWLRRIGHNLFIDQCRRKQRSPVDFNSEEATAAEATWNGDFLPHDDGFAVMELLESCLEGLPERQREMVKGFYTERESRETLAGRFGISPDGVKMALRRIRSALGDCVEQKLSRA